MKTPVHWSSVGSLIATAVLVRTALRDILPPEAHGLLRALLARAAAAFVQPSDTIVIREADANGVPNELYDAAQLYLGARCLAAAPALHLHKTHGAPRAVASLPDSHTTGDTFRGVRVTWTSQFDEAMGTYSGHYSGRGFLPPVGVARQQRRLRLEFPSRDGDVVRGAYIPHVLDEAAKLRLEMRERRLYTNNPVYGGGGGGRDDHQMLWTAHPFSHPFSHPSTFDTLAIDPALRDGIRADLLRFVRRREHYARAGRAWKRGYLLHGPPGTGKTSLVAAIANLLEFDIYDLELTTVGSNSDLRRLLASTRPKSLIVIEDIDCSLGLFDRTRTPHCQEAESDPGMPRPAVTVLPPTMKAMMQREKISLSGVLNFVDGLWSSCVGERLVVFTTNHVDRLDTALLRPGRMDCKVELGYCKAPALLVLAKNYLGEDCDHEVDDVCEVLMREAERLLEEVPVTPADVAEVFMGCDGEGAQAALRKLVDELNCRKIVP